MAPAELLSIEVMWSPQPRDVRSVAVSMPAGATVGHALAASGLFTPPDAWRRADLRLGVWGRLADEGTVLRDHDRVELYRPLLVDPKEARRLRHRSHGDVSTRAKKKPR